MVLQSQQYTTNSETLDQLSKEKRASVAELNQLLSKINYMDFPEFNSSIRFELWEDNFDNKKIRIYYCSLMLFEFNQN